MNKEIKSINMLFIRDTPESQKRANAEIWKNTKLNKIQLNTAALLSE